MPSRAPISRFPATLFIAPLLGALVIATSASAGSICGTVRDADTNQPVAQAAIFLYDDTDTYTGIHTATDISGMYCLLNVSPGTYTLQVRRDDYITEVVTGVEVTGTGTAVDVVAYPDLRIRVWPNPASDDIQFEIGSTDGTPVTLSVYDVKGRFVRGWKGVSSGGQTIGWNLRDLKGDPIASGVYFVRLQTARHRVTRRFVRFR